MLADFVDTFRSSLVEVGEESFPLFVDGVEYFVRIVGSAYRNSLDFDVLEFPVEVANVVVLNQKLSITSFTKLFQNAVKLSLGDWERSPALLYPSSEVLHPAVDNLIEHKVGVHV